MFLFSVVLRSSPLNRDILPSECGWIRCRAEIEGALVDFSLRDADAGCLCSSAASLLIEERGRREREKREIKRRREVTEEKKK